MEKKVYYIQSIDCANCAAKIEHKINQMPEVQEAILTFATKQLRITAEDPDALLPKIQALAEAVEPGVTITPKRERRPPAPAHAHSHPENSDCEIEQEHGHSDCDCGHDHEHHHEHSDCDCGHEHEHPHHHSDCDCGHDHEHHHEHSVCGCGHDHEHPHEPEQNHPHASHDGEQGHSHGDGASLVKKVYYIYNIDCANCAANIERKINQIPEVQEAVLTFATKQLRITAEDPDALLSKIQAVAEAAEPGVVITQKKGGRPSSSENAAGHLNHAHEHGEKQGPSPENSKQAGDRFSESHSGDRRELKEQAAGGKTSFSLRKLLAHPLTALIAGAVLFIAGELTEFHSTLSFLLFLVAYLVLCAPILKMAGTNLLHGKIFDENFLMSVATLGAFVIQEFGEAVGVMLFYRIGEYFEERAVERSRKQIMDAADLRPETVQRLENGRTETIAAEDAVPGDLLLVRPGDRIPLDGTVVEGESRLDTSPITGEPVPVAVAPGSSILSGCVNTSGLLKIQVEKPLSESMVSRILESVENAAAGKPQMERFLTRFARVYTPMVLLLALGTALIPSFLTGDWNYWVYTALTFLVISCPCALVLSVPLAFFSGIGAGSKRGILFKGGLSLEAMRRVKAIVMDKTGTITEGTFALRSCEAAAGISEQELLGLAAACESSSTHPIGQSIRDAAAERGISPATPENIEEIAGKGILARIQGSEVLCGNRRLLEMKQIPYPSLSDPSGSEVLLARDGAYAGRLLISDQLKGDSAAAIARLRADGFKTVMLTGDTEEGAARVAKETGVDSYRSRLLPEEKLSALQEVRKTYGPVMFIGDGINDAPVLAGADVGAAMGSGADAAIEAADAVFMTSRLSAIPQALQIAKATSRISVQNVVFALIVKALVMVLGLAGEASMWMAVFADSGVAMLCVLNSIRILYKK